MQADEGQLGAGSAHVEQGCRRVIRWGRLFLAAGVLAGLVTACRPIQAPPPLGAGAVTVTLDKAQDRATVSAANGRTQIDIYSPSGIGGAEVTWEAQVETPPVLRLHLRGLEELRLANDSGEVVASVASSIPHTVRQAARRTTDTELQPITAEDQEWLAISWAAEDAAAVFPLEDGYFDVVLRDPRLVEPGTTLQIRWIDFYR